VSEMLAVPQWMILGLAVGKVETDDHGHRSLAPHREAPATDAAEEVDGAGGTVARQADRSRHLGGDGSFGAIQEYDVTRLASLRIDQVERYALERLWLPVG